MADVQSQFEKFHEAIRIDYEMSSELREKRDILVDRIKDYLKAKEKPTVHQLLQGSYKMKTGVKPLGEQEYDIDIGLRMTLDDQEPSVVRGWIHDAVKDHTKRCENRGPCIRVVYEAGFHLDLVAYRVRETNGTEEFHLAHKTEGWRPADPVRLMDHVTSVRERFADTEDSATQTDQFRRVVRCMRRWEDVHVPEGAEGKLAGLAFVLLCCDHLTVQRHLDGRPDDHLALQLLAERLGTWSGRLSAQKPTPEYEDMLAGLDDQQMDALKARFRQLAQVLSNARLSVDPVDACQKLRDELGDDFPVPTPEDSGKKTKAPAIITSSTSA